MRWKFSILVMALTAITCSLNAPDQTVSEVVPSPTSKSSSETETPTPNIIPVQPSPLPTTTIIPTQTLAPPDSGSTPVTTENRIQFPAGGTWVEVSTYLNEGDAIEYVLSAMKDQVMSVSIDQAWPFIVEVTDSTTILTDPDNVRSFWRGRLPATGDYFITVKTMISGEFTMRVAINPPGQEYQYFDYTNPQPTVTLRYSDEFAPVATMPVGDFKGTPSLVLQLINPEIYRPTTNLGEAYFLFSTIDDPERVATCTQPLPPFETTVIEKTINGYTFTQTEAIDVAAGNVYDQIVYRTVYNNVCYEIVFYLHSVNIGNFTPGSVEEYDRVALTQKFEQILSTFTVK